MDESPNKEEIRDFHQKSGLEIKKLFNASGVKYKELGLKDKLNTLSVEELYDILASDGMLVKRPILTDGNRVLVGFKEKDWEEAFAGLGKS